MINNKLFALVLIFLAMVSPGLRLEGMLTQISSGKLPQNSRQKAISEYKKVYKNQNSKKTCLDAILEYEKKRRSRQKTSNHRSGDFIVEDYILISDLRGHVTCANLIQEISKREKSYKRIVLYLTTDLADLLDEFLEFIRKAKPIKTQIN